MNLHEYSSSSIEIHSGVLAVSIFFQSKFPHFQTSQDKIKVVLPDSVPFGPSFEALKMFF
jgi:hypothetical protein